MCVCTVCVFVTPTVACKHDISRREDWTDLIFGMYSRCTTLSTRSLLFLVQVKVHLRSTAIGQIVKACKHDISSREAWTMHSHIWYVRVPH